MSVWRPRSDRSAATSLDAYFVVCRQSAKLGVRGQVESHGHKGHRSRYIVRCALYTYALSLDTVLLAESEVGRFPPSAIRRSI